MQQNLSSAHGHIKHGKSGRDRKGIQEKGVFGLGQHEPAQRYGKREHFLKGRKEAGLAEVRLCPA